MYVQEQNSSNLDFLAGKESYERSHTNLCIFSSRLPAVLSSGCRTWSAMRSLAFGLISISAAVQPLMQANQKCTPYFLGKVASFSVSIAWHHLIIASTSSNQKSISDLKEKQERLFTKLHDLSEEYSAILPADGLLQV